jgi:ABC-type multidrug transport system ATPase subunit
MAVPKLPHVRAILFRRWTLFLRSMKAMLISGVLTLIFSALAIVANYLMKSLMKDRVRPYDFNSFFHGDYDRLVVTLPESDTTPDDIEMIRILGEMYRNDTGRTAEIRNFSSRDALNRWMYDNACQKVNPEGVVMGVGFHDRFPPFYPYNLTAYYNGTWIRNEEMAARIQLTRLAWKKEFGPETDFRFSVTRLMKKLMDMMFGQMAPMLIVCGLISVIPLIISQPIIDIRGEVRDYMISCTLTLVPYWGATFLVDLLIWVILVNLVWVVFIAFQIVAILDNLFASWYAFMCMGPSFILFVYCLSFAFGSAESATRQMFILLVLVMLVPMIVMIVRQEPNPTWLDWIYALIPHIAEMQILQDVLVHVNILKQPLSYYWKPKSDRMDGTSSLPYLIMQFVDIVIYAILLFVIETMRSLLSKRYTKFAFSGYEDFFNQVKSRHPVTEEVREMESAVNSDTGGFAVRIVDCSRLFFNTAGEPIAAVNRVTLGVRENSVFGFLGANGAGKTTLIKMITSLLPSSSGAIYINGIDISENHDPELLSICPQFNSHLCDEMTPREHFRLYRLLHRMDTDEAIRYADELVEVLDLTAHADKPVRELSGGNQRKLAVALSFFAPSKIVLLDEPTSSLDPVARHHVHDMIGNHRGRKTFMLCTHLLSEAESLCDQISIMIKGCVYTCGTPQYLSQKFGTEFKIDVMLNKDDSTANEKCTRFFTEQLPQAVLTILRPNVRIYSIPSDIITLSDLFTAMENGAGPENGFGYYTCSSSSLERVFMEIVHLSEHEDAVFAKNAAPVPP